MNREELLEEVEFTVTCKMRKRWAIQFLAMLKLMEYFGQVGSSRTVSFYSDGDGDFRPKFESSITFPEVEEALKTSTDNNFDAG